MKFAVLKGREGYGDRLQCLLQAIRYSTATGRILVVDWRDSDWTHDKRLNFEHYFKFDGIANFPYEAFEQYLKSNLDHLSVTPKSWKPRLLDDDYEHFIYSPVFQMDNSDQMIWKIASWKAEDFDEDVVVLPVKGVRTFRYEDFGLVTCQPWIGIGFVDLHKIKDSGRVSMELFTCAQAPRHGPGVPRRVTKP